MESNSCPKAAIRHASPFAMETPENTFEAYFSGYFVFSRGPEPRVPLFE